MRSTLTYRPSTTRAAMTTARPDRWSPPANCMLIAREMSTGSEPTRPRRVAIVLTWAYLVGAGDGNRTRTISLGS
jgi:hypothetical protein